MPIILYSSTGHLIKLSIDTFSTLKASFSTARLSGDRFITQFELKIIQTAKSTLLDVDAQKMPKLIKETIIPTTNLLQWVVSNLFHCVIWHWFSLSFYHFSWFFHCVIRHPVYSDTTFISQCTWDLTGLTVFQSEEYCN